MIGPADDAEVRALLDDVCVRFHHDFRRYAMASLRRRVGLAVVQLGCGDVRTLRQRLAEDPALFGPLLRHLTVQVSEMFRDPPFFLYFRQKVVPELRTYPSAKIWVAGCSTGEEAYSLAIVLSEEGLLDRTLIYATDINPEALRYAEAGIYPLEKMAAFSERYRAAGGQSSLSEHYTAAYGSAALDRRLRTNMVFSDHSLATDSVFAEVHVVSCRNVLIYFDRQLQDRAIGLFSEALCRRGFLGLGSKETLQFSAHARAFEALDPDTRWYQRC